MPQAADFNDRNLSLGLARVSEAAAIACTPSLAGAMKKPLIRPLLMPCARS